MVRGKNSVPHERGAAVSVCDCQTWKANIDKIDAPLILAQIRQPSYMVDFVRFVYCPWCGQALRATEPQSEERK